MMKREAYELANSIKTECGTDKDRLTECPGDVEMKKYKNHILQEIRREKNKKRRTFRGGIAAACAAAILLTGTLFFDDEVHAMINQISWNIGSALGLAGDLADYREVVNTSVADNGYVVTLQEAVVSEEKLVVNYTLQREDGGAISMPDPLALPNLDGTLYINGKNVTGAVGGSSEFLDEEHTAVGMVSEYFLHDMDLSGENDFQIHIRGDRIDDGIKGKWNFSFKADGSLLLADTKRTAIGKTFELPNGGTITLDEFTSNELEQRISYSLSEGSDYLFKVEAEDSNGNQAEFDVRIQDKDSGHMQNQEILEDGRLNGEAGLVTMTLYAVEMPKESGRMSEDYIQIGEPFTIELP